jgi:transcription antitermination factor NusG
VKGKPHEHELSSMNTWSDTTLVAWFVARTKPNREDYAERTLQLRRVDSFLPRIVEVGPGTITRPAPLFPGYLFVHIDLFADWQRVIWAPGIRDFVSLGGAPIPIDNAVIDQLKLRCDERGVAYVSPAMWNRGDRVEIADGPFAGLLATVETVMPQRRRIKLLIDFLARQTSVDLPLTAIKGLPEAPPRFVRPAIHA